MAYARSSLTAASERIYAYGEDQMVKIETETLNGRHST
jgi:hypothetical protein